MYNSGVVLLGHIGCVHWHRTRDLCLKVKDGALLFPSGSAWTLRTRKPLLYSSALEWCAPSDRGFPLLPTRFMDLEALESHRLSPSSENDFRSSSSSLWRPKKTDSVAINTYVSRLISNMNKHIIIHPVRLPLTLCSLLEEQQRTRGPEISHKASNTHWRTFISCT